ncbi:hypothetical protein TNCV_3247561 [Trichonephila clavipes]|nr:hypothetical protein TNCV_3247561 [Trichonephila clavipes]
MNRTLRAPQSWPIIPQQKQPNHQTLTQISRYFSKPSHTIDEIKPQHKSRNSQAVTHESRKPPSDATAYLLASNMVSFVLLFAETLAGEYVTVGYLYELVPTSREDDRFGVICKVLAFVRNGRYPERTFLPSLVTLTVI